MQPVGLCVKHDRANIPDHIDVLELSLWRGLVLVGNASRLFGMRIVIRFPDRETEQRALGKLIPRFSGKSWSSGEVAVPSGALSYLADEGIRFTVIGPAPYELLASLRDSGAAAV